MPRAGEPACSDTAPAQRSSADPGGAQLQTGHAPMRPRSYFPLDGRMLAFEKVAWRRAIGRLSCYQPEGELYMLITSSLINLQSDHDGAGHQKIAGATLKRGDPHKTWKALAVLIAASMTLPGVRLPHAMAQAAGSAATSSAQAPLSQDKLDSLLAPIA